MDGKMMGVGDRQKSFRIIILPHIILRVKLSVSSFASCKKAPLASLCLCC